MKQVDMRQSHQYRKFLHDIKDIFFDCFFADDLHENAPIIGQLVTILEKVHDPTIDVQEKMMQWEEKKYASMVMKKVPSEIVIKQVEISTLIIELE